MNEPIAGSLTSILYHLGNLALRCDSLYMLLDEAGSERCSIRILASHW